MHFPVTGECLGWRTTDFEELHGDLGRWKMTKELVREQSTFLYIVVNMLGPLIFLSALAFTLGDSHVTQMRWCTIKALEQQKCQDFLYALKNVSSEINTTLQASCVQGSNAIDCMQKIKDGQADLITLDGGEIYEAGKNYEMTPVVAEFYGESTGTSYYAVAVVKKSGSVKSIKDLRGKKTCHTGAGKTAGWVVPVGTLLSKKYMDQDSTCNPYVSAGKYFSESCVPRVKEEKIDTKGENPDNLCALCKSECTKDGNYSGYSGAFKCLMDGVGEVAFVKHTTVMSEAPASASDYLYLCYDGTTAEIGEHLKCHLAKVPSHAVMTKKGHSKMKTYVKILLEASTRYGNDSGDGFRMFDSSKYPDGKDLLFKDSTEKLQNVSSQTYEQFLGAEYMGDIAAINDCVAATTVPVSATTVPTSAAESKRPFFVGSLLLSLVALVLLV